MGTLSIPSPGNTTGAQKEKGMEVGGASRGLHQSKITVLLSPPVKNVNVACQRHSHFTFFTNELWFVFLVILLLLFIHRRNE